MEYLRVRNWGEFQHYKKRNPPWIKLHRQLLSNYEFSCLQDASKAHLILIWLLASQCDNKIPNDVNWIHQKIGTHHKPDINRLIELNFLECYQDASNVLSTCISQTETETEKTPPTPPRGNGTWEIPEGVNTTAWADYEKHRKDIRKPMTDLARNKAVKFLKTYDLETQQEIIDASIRGRWAGLFEPKGKKPNHEQPRNWI